MRVSHAFTQKFFRAETTGHYSQKLTVRLSKMASRFTADKTFTFLTIVYFAPAKWRLCMSISISLEG